MTEKPPFGELPEAVVATPGENRPWLIWIIPLVAALTGIWVAVTTILDTGPTVTIDFLTAEGLEAGKTKVRFKDVDIGEVKALTISPDRSRIIVTAQFSKEAESFLVKDTRFWVVKPRFSGGQISGVNTLLSGAYIALDVGDSTEKSDAFKGLEVAPILTDELPGRQFMLEASDMGSLDIGSPVYFRHVNVGEVIAYELDPNGRDVHLRIFVHEPYDRYVNVTTRFWNASGFDVSLDSNGMKLETQSLVTIISGGVAFETPPGQADSERAEAGHTFPLHRDRTVAMKTLRGEPEIVELHFLDSLRGLAPGASVELRGIPIGEVLSVDLNYDRDRKSFDFPVTVALYREQLGMHHPDGSPVTITHDEKRRNEVLDALIRRGLRAQIRTGSLLTGQLYVAFDFFEDAPAVRMDWSQHPLQLPTVPGVAEELQQAVGRLVRKVDKIPFDEIGNNTRDTLATLNETSQNLNRLISRLHEETAPEAAGALSEIRKTLDSIQKTIAVDSPLQQELRQALRETSRTAQSVRSLADTLDTEPESLLRGKQEDQK